MGLTRRGGRLGLAATLLLVLVGCTSVPGRATGSSAESEASTAAPSAAQQPDGFEGLCGWVSPADLEAVFGAPMDAVGDRECPVVAAGDLDTSGIYHVALDQQAGLDESISRREANQEGMGFTICDQEFIDWEGLRISRVVTCPNGGTTDFQPRVELELAPGRVLTTQPFPVATEQEAQEASRTFVELLKAFARTGKGKPMINEVLPGQWMEIYNPGGEPADLSGSVITNFDYFDDAPVAPLQIPDGTVAAPGSVVVVDISALAASSGETPQIGLTDADGLFLDEADLAGVPAGEVKRRNGDGGVYCSFGSAAVTQGAPNPPATEGCD